LRSGEQADVGVVRSDQIDVEIALRLLGRAVAGTGDEGPVELAKLESLNAELKSAQNRAEPRFRRTLAGAQVTLADGKILVERAPPRHGRPLTKAGPSKSQKRQNALE
jgi:tRNA(Ile)-lysidine synthase